MCYETLLVVVTAITLHATVTIKVYALLDVAAEPELIRGCGRCLMCRDFYLTFIKAELHSHPK